MADNYLTFSEVLPHLTPEEEAWLQSQLQTVYVFEGIELTENQLASDVDLEKADWIGCRAWRDMPDYDEDGKVGFQYAFHDGHGLPIDRGRYLWVYDEEQGDPWRVAHLVQKFLQTFRPDQCWSITYALSCSKPRAREFGGGGIFVTAAEIRTYDGHDLVDQKTRDVPEDRKRQEQIRILMQKAAEGKLPEGMLDEAVHDAASAMAARINNGGLEGRIGYLVSELGATEAESVVSDLVEEQQVNVRRKDQQ